MSTKVYPYGSKEFTVASGDKIAAFSKAPAQIYKKSDGAAPVWSLYKALLANENYSSAATSSITTFRVDSGGDEVLVNTGTDAVVIENLPFQKQGAPGVLDVTGALTAAMIASGIVTSAAAAVTGTLPTGAVMEAALDMEIGDSFDWVVIKVGANAFTVAAAASGHTCVGALVVATATSARFRTRKTAFETFVTYALG